MGSVSGGHGESIRVLHVDDDLEFADTAAAFLEREDDRFDVEAISSVDEGLDRLADGAFDCVVSDYEMPGRDGIEFLEVVRERYPNLPFVLYTGQGSEVVASEAISAGVTDYLQKETGTDQYAILANRIENAVTARRTARDAEQRRHRLEQILKTVPSCVVQLDRAGRFVFANDRAVEVLGLSESELTDRTYNDLEWNIRGPDGTPIPESELPFRQVRDSGEPLYGFRHTIEWPDGTRKVLSVNGAPLFDEDRAVESVVFSLSDVTESVTQQSDLQRARARLEVLFENSPDMVNVHDADGNILNPNAQLIEETGYTQSELLDMKVWELDSTLDRAAAYDLWEGFDVGDRERLEGAYERRDGSTFPVEIHVRRIDMGGQDRFVVISRDISERKQREVALERQNQRLEEFASVVSHDLRNPLNVAQGRLDLVAEECDSDHIDDVANAHDRMGALIDDLLTLAREGRSADEVESIDLAELAAECWRNVDTAGATLAVEVDADRRIRADRGGLQRLFENLMRNSVEHGSTGSRSQAHGNSVEHGGTDVTITVGELDDGTGFYVEDDGPGIPEADREAVFEAGYSTAADGTGFGLAIVREIAEAHGWTARVADAADGGARVEFAGVAVDDA